VQHGVYQVQVRGECELCDRCNVLLSENANMKLHAYKDIELHHPIQPNHFAIGASQKRRAPIRPATPAAEKAPTWKADEAADEAVGEVDALDAELAAEAEEWLAVLAEAELIDDIDDIDMELMEDMVAAEAEEAELTLDAPAVVDAPAAEVPAAPEVEEAALTDADWPTQLVSGPAWMVIGEEYWMFPTLSRTWMVMEVCAGRFTFQVSELVFWVGKLSRAVPPG